MYFKGIRICWLMRRQNAAPQVEPRGNTRTSRLNSTRSGRPDFSRAAIRNVDRDSGRPGIYGHPRLTSKRDQRFRRSRSALPVVPVTLLKRYVSSPPGYIPQCVDSP
jgi:hypothetical protein